MPWDVFIANPTMKQKGGTIRQNGAIPHMWIDLTVICGAFYRVPSFEVAHLSACQDKVSDNPAVSAQQKYVSGYYSIRYWIPLNIGGQPRERYLPERTFGVPREEQFIQLRFRILPGQAHLGK